MLLNKISAVSGQGLGSRFAILLFSTLSGLVLSQPAFAANITVASPVSGTKVSTAIWVRAHNIGCNSLQPQAFGYSLDNNSAIAWGVTPYDIDVTNVPVSAGTHTIHFKSWTSRGLCTVANTTFTASAPASTGSGSTGSSGSGSTGSSSSSSGSGTGSGPNGGSTGGGSSNPQAPPTGTVTGTIPTNAISSGLLDAKTSWAFEKDEAMPGQAQGSTVYPATTPAYDEAREFYMDYWQRSGIRWHLSFAKDTSATHFVYDTYIYIVDPTQVANIELDMNQVVAGGQTVILGTQCSTYSKTWEYTIVNNGTHWHPSNIPCNPQTWAAKTWHHVQIASHRDDKGNVGYDWVNFDGTHSDFQNATGYSAEALGWDIGTLLINFQLDGASASNGTITAYAHGLTVLRW